MKAKQELIDSWRAVSLSEPPYLHPGDVGTFEGGDTVVYSSFREYSKTIGEGISTSRSLHTGLIPVPFVGDIGRAKVLLLALNPGFEPSNYYTENDPVFRRLLERNLHQDFSQTRFPCWVLDPEFGYHGGFSYWERRLRYLAGNVRERNGGSYREALSWLAGRIAILQLVPYHSGTFGLKNRTLKMLESTRLMRRFVHAVSIGDGSQKVIVLRKARDWDLPKSPHVKVNPATNTRGMWMGENSPVRDFLFDALGLA